MGQPALRTGYLTLLILLSATQFTQAIPINGDFSAGLDGWSVLGDVEVDQGIAVLGDAEGTADLTQAFRLDQGLYTLSFRVNRSELFNGPLFDDLFTATYYAFDVVPGDSLPANPVVSADRTLNLLDLTAGDARAYDGSLTPGGDDWLDYIFTFNHIHNAGYLEFFLTGFDASDGNSRLRLDDIELVIVPEPTHLTALGLLIFGAVARRHRQRPTSA